MVGEGGEQKQGEKAAVADIKQSPEFKAALADATSQLQRREAEARKSLKAVEERASQHEAELSRLKDEAEIMKAAGDDEGRAALLKQIAQGRRDAQEDKKEALKVRAEAEVTARQATMVILASKYGLDMAQLDQYGTAAEMETGAKDLYIQQLEVKVKQTAPSNGSTENPKPASRPQGHDTGNARLPGVQLDLVKLALSKDPADQKKFEDYAKERQRTLQRR